MWARVPGIHSRLLACYAMLRGLLLSCRDEGLQKAGSLVAERAMRVGHDCLSSRGAPACIRSSSPAPCRSTATRRSRPGPAADRTWPDKVTTKAPRWCAVDLRDGNQALIDPMDARPQAADVRAAGADGLQGDRGRLPRGQPDRLRLRPAAHRGGPDPRRRDDPGADPGPRRADRAHLRVPARAPSRRSCTSTTPPPRCSAGSSSARTAPASSTSPSEGAQLVQEAGRRRSPSTTCYFEYSPESFTGTELDFAVEICDAVIDVWEPTPDRPSILNLPATVEMATPNVYADQIEWMHRNLGRRDSRRALPAPAQRPRHRRGRRRAGLHGRRRPHRGLPVRQRRAHRQRRPGHAGPEPVQPGHRPADRLLRHRRGPPHVEYCNQLPVHPRHPYGGDLVYTAFSGSHQDAIKKGFEALERDAAARAYRRRVPGRCRTCRSTPRTSAAATRRSSGSTASPARAASPTS